MSTEFTARVSGVEKLTALDFPHKLAAVLFYTGCNNRCPYCYNPSVVKGTSPRLEADEVKTFLRRRKKVLDGVVFSGGECTLWGDKLIADIEWTRSLGYAVKVDTNGTRPDVVKELITRKLVDYVALDVKSTQTNLAPFYAHEQDYDAVFETLALLTDSDVSFETRTTIHPDLTDENELSGILASIVGVTHGKAAVHGVQFFFRGDLLEYLDPDINTNPRWFNLDKVEKHGLELSVRNPEGNS